MTKLSFITLLRTAESTSDWSNHLCKFCQHFVLSQCLFLSALIYQMLRGSRLFPLPCAVCCFVQLLMVYFHHTESYKWAIHWLKYVNFSNCFGALKRELCGSGELGNRFDSRFAHCCSSAANTLIGMWNYFYRCFLKQSQVYGEYFDLTVLPCSSRFCTFY